MAHNLNKSKGCQREQRTDPKNEAKKIKSNEFTQSNRTKSNIAITLLKNWQFDTTKNNFVFWLHQYYFR